MNIIKRIQLEICWRRGHRIYFGPKGYCSTCAEKKKPSKEAQGEDVPGHFPAKSE